MASSVTATTYPSARNDASESKLETWVSAYWSDGVVWAAGNELALFADSTGMVVKLPTGSHMVGGVRGDLAAQTSLDIAAANATNPRIDTVVAELDRTPSPYTIVFKVVTGTAASSPVVPTLTNNATTRQIAIGDVRVDAAVSTIAASKVTLRRTFTGDTGWLTYSPGVYPIDTSGTGSGWAAPSVVADPGNIGRYRCRGMSCEVDVTQLVKFTTGAGFEYAYDLPKVGARRGSRGVATVQNVMGIAYTEPKSSAFGFTGSQISLASIRKYDSSALLIDNTGRFDGFTFSYEVGAQ